MRELMNVNAKELVYAKHLTVSSNVWSKSNTGEAEFTFPSVEERIQFYMGSWYDFDLSSYYYNSENNNNNNNNNVTTRNTKNVLTHENYNMNNNTIDISKLICDKSLRRGYANSRIVSHTLTIYPFDALLHRNEMPKHWTGDYLKDVTNVMTHSDTNVEQEYHDEKYVILSVGDATFEDKTKPIVFKARKIMKSVDESFRPIIWPLRMNRHFHEPLNHLQMLVRDGDDTKWEDKKNVVHWRGSGDTGRPKGTRVKFAKKFGAMNEMYGMNIGLYAMSSISRRNCKLTSCTYCFKPQQDVKTMLQYKYLLSLEGNDVATDLKWKLASSSVVFMPEPVTESYMMESKLVPYVHYIPVKEDGSDLLKQLQWAKDNDEKCKWISEQANKIYGQVILQ